VRAGLYRAALAVVALTVLPVGCGPKAPDYQSIWTTTTTATPTTTEAPVPFAQYLKDNGITGEPVAPDKLTDLTVSIPTPQGWQKADKPNIAPTRRACARFAQSCFIHRTHRAGMKGVTPGVSQG